MSTLVVIDVQPVLTKTIFEVERVLARIGFLGKIATLLDIPIMVTEQNPDRMGTTHDALAGALASAQVFSKMSFDAAKDAAFMRTLETSRRRQVILTGVETHICVGLTAQSLLSRGLQVVVCPDAVSSRTQERHKLGMERNRDAGAVPAHTESVAYEWLGTADHPNFKAVLQIVKEHP